MIAFYLTMFRQNSLETSPSILLTASFLSHNVQTKHVKSLNCIKVMIILSISQCSDKTFTQKSVGSIMFDFLSHNVQTKPLVRKCLPAKRLAFLSHNVQTKPPSLQSCLIFLQVFLSHNVQTKLRTKLSRAKSGMSFLSHNVQTKLSSSQNI